VVEKRFIARTHGAVKDAAALIEALDGDLRTGMCCCPAHDDDTPSLSVTEKDGKVLWFCHAGCTQAAVRDAFLWPITNSAPGSRVNTPRRSDDERRDFALKILADTAANRGRELAGELKDYFERRGIKRVPPTAMLALPWNLDPHQSRRLIADDPAMVFEVTDGQKILGAHVTYLKTDAEGYLTAKRDAEPQRQFFGPISGGFIRLYAGEHEAKAKLLIAEGVETAAAASQITGLPAIAALSAKNLPKIRPPLAAEYLVCADNDPAGLSGAHALAFKLKRAGHRVRVAIPPHKGFDWNDELKGEQCG
jgi:putative DNA primase/helicase